MKDFLDRASELLAEGGIMRKKSEIEALFEFRTKLRTVYPNSVFDLRNIESFLSAIEMGARRESEAMPMSQHSPYGGIR